MGLANTNSLFALLQPGTLGLRQEQPLAMLDEFIGYVFQNAALAETAFTHGSHKNKLTDYQRLEFLGDRVLSLVIADELYNRYSEEREGQLAARLSLLVRAEACAAVGKALRLEDLILLGAVEKRKGVQRVESVLGDVVEALIGAIYLDGGMAAAREFILRNWSEMLSHTAATLKDAKTFVQEWALGRALSLPHYEVLKREGSEHAPTFTIGLRVGKYETAQGSGKSKQMAEMAAAQAFITRETLR